MTTGENYYPYVILSVAIAQPKNLAVGAFIIFYALLDSSTLLGMTYKVNVRSMQGIPRREHRPM